MSGKVLFVNITRRCNVQCDRCYLTEVNRKSSAILPWGVLEKIINSEWAKDGLTIIWEGGEASLVGKAHFFDMVKRTKECNPKAVQTMVSNLYHFPSWLIELTNQYFDSSIETTFAMGGKFSLSRNHEQYLSRFKRNFKKLKSAGINCVINIELNDYTIDAGPDALLDYLEDVAPFRMEFDISVNFQKFLAKPQYLLSGYPVLPPTISYQQFSQYIYDLYTMIKARKMESSISCGVINEIVYSQLTTMFNVGRLGDFLTVNPDGTLTTNPLFSDMSPTYLGNLNHTPIEALLASKKREHFIRHELRKFTECQGCEYLDICSGGPSHAPTHDGSGECSGLKMLRKRMS